MRIELGGRRNEDGQRSGWAGEIRRLTWVDSGSGTHDVHLRDQKILKSGKTWEPGQRNINQ